MRISELRILNVRNLQAAEISPAEHVNLIYGRNASGKTSLLESLYVLSRGKSFRTNQLRNLIQKGQDNFVLFGRMMGEDDRSVDIGVSYRNRRIKLQAQGRPVKKASELTSFVPLVVIHQESHRLLLEGPGQRRNFMDWALFHVEPSFHALWHRYGRALKQRNVSLQNHAARKVCEVWNDELVTTAQAIDQLRKNLLSELKPCFEDFVSRLLPSIGEVGMKYQAGWDEGIDFASVLREAYPSDNARGYTRFGPHRADIVMTQDGVLLRERVSRGQQKLLICALYLAQLRYFRERTRKACILLIDDIAAELDPLHRNLLLELVRALDVQVFMTATDALEGVPGGLVQKRFHVEHGKVKQVL